MNHQIIENSNFTTYFNVHIVLWKMMENGSRRFYDSFSKVNSITRFLFSKDDNYYYTLKAFNKLLNKWPGLVITNDGFEVQALKRFGTDSTIFSIVHDFYNLNIAINSLDIVDYFLCYTKTYAKTLLSGSLSTKRVYYLTHGVKVEKYAVGKAIKSKGRLKVVSISRLVQQKGVMDLFQIDKRLILKGVQVDWIFIGSGDLESNLKEQWKEKENVLFYKPQTNEEVIEIARTGDIFISPSTFEGYGIALLEAMSCGLVPIIHKLPIGIYSSLPKNVGYSIPIGNIEGFIESIIILDRDRELLLRKSVEAKKYVFDNYNIAVTANNFLQTLNANSLPQVKKYLSYKNVSSFGILDQSFVPNKLARILKKLKRAILSSR